MRNNVLWIGTMMLMIASCSNEEILLNEELKDIAEPTFTVIAAQGEEANSRIAYNPSADGKILNLTWAAEDVIYVCEAENPYHFIELTLVDGAGSNRGTFSTAEPLPSSWNQNTELIAYYKANEKMYSLDEYDNLFFYRADYYGVNQVQSENGSMTHLKNVNYMVSDKFNYEANTISNLHFSQKGAIMQFKLSGLEGKTVTELELSVDDGSQSLLKYEYDYIYSYGISDEYYYNNVYVPSTSMFFGTKDSNDSYSGITIDTGEKLTAYLMLGATDKTDGKTLTLTAKTTDGSYIASITGGELEAGKLYTIEKTVDIPYVTFKATAMQQFTLKQIGNYTLDTSLQYSVGGGEWKQLTFENTNITFGGSNGDLRLRGKSSTGTANTNQEICARVSFNNTTPVACSGDIRTLVDWEHYTTASTANARFGYLFKECSQLVSAPDLPATELATYCYSNMFYQCTSLTTAPILPATELASCCYASMFHYCSNLNHVTMLGTNNVSMFNLMNWLKDVAATGTFYKNSSMTNTSNLYIPDGWTVKNYGE